MILFKVCLSKWFVTWNIKLPVYSKIISSRYGKEFNVISRFYIPPKIIDDDSRGIEISNDSRGIDLQSLTADRSPVLFRYYENNWMIHEGLVATPYFLARPANWDWRGMPGFSQSLQKPTEWLIKVWSQHRVFFNSQQGRRMFRNC